MLALKECKTADEVIANYKQVRDRVRRWHKPRLVEIVKEVEQEVTALAQPVTPDPVPPPIVDSVEEKRYPPFAEILAMVSRFYRVSENDIKSHRREAIVMRPRQVVMYLARHLTLLTLPQIGRKLGDRDHTTIMHGIAKITALRETYALLDAELRDFEARLS